MREPLHHPENCDLRFEACNRHTGTRVRACAEGEMAVWVAGDVKAAGVVELLRIAICRADTESQVRARLKCHLADRDRLDDQPVPQLVRALEAQAFLD